MKNRLFKLAAAITLSVFLLGGAVIAASEIIDFENNGPVQTTQTEPARAEEIHQSFSADVEEMDKIGKIQYPMIVLIFGFTVIIAGVNYRLRE